jgi:hypothetical protein
MANYSIQSPSNKNRIKIFHNNLPLNNTHFTEKILSTEDNCDVAFTI